MWYAELHSCGELNFQVQLANQNQLGDHYSSKHPKEKPPSDSSWFYLSLKKKKHKTEKKKNENSCVLLELVLVVYYMNQMSGPLYDHKL